MTQDHLLYVNKSRIEVIALPPTQRPIETIYGQYKDKLGRLPKIDKEEEEDEKEEEKLWGSLLTNRPSLCSLHRQEKLAASK